MELVSPAGNIEKLYYAYTYGADAAYIGLKKFSLRVKADNFYEEEYKQIIDLKNSYPGKRLFCALNISFHNKDIDNFLSELDYFKSYPIDAFIIQDIGMVSIIQKYFPQATLHLSTQANCINREAVKMYRSLGFKRVVVGRETTLNEIREIKDAVPDMEIEAFGHGAMCIAYSGRCLLSAYLTGRSANGGACSHSCRWDYDLLTSMPQSGSLVLQEKKRQGEYFPVFEGDDFTAILSSKDICMIDHLEDMKKAGVDSLKIEGRMKSIYYVALVTRAYRKAIDAMEGKISQEEARPFIDELYNTNHREFATGFYYGQEEANKTTCGATDSPYDMCASVGCRVSSQQLQETASETNTSIKSRYGNLYPETEEEIFIRAKNTETLRRHELEHMHPAARAAREADFAAHPEKCPPVAEYKEGWQFFVYDALNKIDSSSQHSSEATPIEFIAPDKALITAGNGEYQFVNPETGEIMSWVCHGHPCLIYTSLPLQEGMLVRTVNPDFGKETHR